MQLAAATLDPELDPFSVAQTYVLRNTIRQLASGANPRKLFYEAQKARIRVGRVLDAVEGALERFCV